MDIDNLPSSQGDEQSTGKQAGLRQDDTLAAAILRQAPVMVAYVDRSGHYRFVNRAYCERFGLRPEEAVGKHVAEVFGQPAYEAVRAHMDQALQGHEVEFEKEVVLTRLGRRVMHARYTPEFDASGKVAGFIAVVTDWTERRAAERALEQSRQRLRAVLDLLPLPLYIADASGRLELMNPAVEKVWGPVNLSQSPETYGQDFRAWWPADGRRVSSEEWGMARALKGETVSAEEVLIEGPDGRRRIILNYATPIRNESGEITGGVAMNVDITPLKQVEEELRKAHQRKDEFLATLSHELRNPLAPILNGLEILKRNPGAEQRDAVLASLQRQAEHLTRLVDDLMDVSRISRGRLELKRRAVSLDELAQTALEAVKPSMEKAQLRLHTELPAQAIFLNADPHRAIQVLINLLSNAVKFTPAGGEIRLSAEVEGQSLLLRVEDSGIGIDADMLEQIFEMFTQAEKGRNRGLSGLGIGLTLAKSLAEMHGGSLQARSAGADKGSEFLLRLPLMETPAFEPQPGDGPSTAACRVLVVDDNQEAAQMLALLLEAEGCSGEIARDGEEGVRMAAELRPDLVLMDIGMPGMNGYEAARHIRSQDWGSEMILVAISGWGQEEDKQASREAGFDHHLVKPASLQALRRILARARVASRRSG